uniref:Uncharacterized protein n=1 Tax=Arundo donax TaxID=35708 RepID=A0A0A9G3S9_ARUDO
MDAEKHSRQTWIDQEKIYFHFVGSTQDQTADEDQMNHLFQHLEMTQKIYL